jgi:superfamily II DNA helicase RecQ
MAETFDNKITRILADLRIEFPLKTLQKVCLEKLANRLDVFAVLPTGYGKSLLYAI